MVEKPEEYPLMVKVTLGDSRFVFLIGYFYTEEETIIKVLEANQPNQLLTAK